LDKDEKNLNGVQDEIKEVLGMNDQFKGSISCKAWLQNQKGNQFIMPLVKMDYPLMLVAIPMAN